MRRGWLQASLFACGCGFQSGRHDSAHRRVRPPGESCHAARVSTDACFSRGGTCSHEPPPAANVFDGEHIQEFEIFDLGQRPVAELKAGTPRSNQGVSSGGRRPGVRRTFRTTAHQHQSQHAHSCRCHRPSHERETETPTRFGTFQHVGFGIVHLFQARLFRIAPAAAGCKRLSGDTMSGAVASSISFRRGTGVSPWPLRPAAGRRLRFVRVAS